MRLVNVFTALFIGSVALLSLLPQATEGCDRRSYSSRASYGPPMYHQPSYAGPRRVINIGMYDDYFQPGTINVPPGTIIRFVNYGRHTHTVTARDGTWDSGDLPPGANYSGQFTYPGTYYIYCRHHTKEKMQGTIVVGGGGR